MKENPMRSWPGIPMLLLFLVLVAAAVWLFASGVRNEGIAMAIGGILLGLGSLLMMIGLYMVEMALAELQKNGVVQLDEERKAAMVSNLLVVLCGDRSTQPIVNAGTLY